MRATRHIATAAVAVAAGVAGSAGASSVQLSGDQRRVIHDATKQYRDLDVALSDGYVPVGEGAER
jgi:hypothetical protein